MERSFRHPSGRTGARRPAPAWRVRAIVEAARARRALRSEAEAAVDLMVDRLWADMNAPVARGAEGEASDAAPAGEAETPEVLVIGAGLRLVRVG